MVHRARLAVVKAEIFVESGREVWTLPEVIEEIFRARELCFEHSYTNELRNLTAVERQIHMHWG